MTAEEHDMIDDAARRICDSDTFDALSAASLEERLQKAITKIHQLRDASGSANHLPAILFDRKAHRLSKLMLLLQGERFDNATVRETVDDILKSTAAMNRFALDLSDGR